MSKEKLKKLVKDVCKKDSSFLDISNITFEQAIETIGKMQEKNYKFKGKK